MDEWIKTEDSSNITRYRYDAANQKLSVEFKSGGMYDYLEVPEEVALALKEAQSKGSYLSKSIRGTYKVAKIEPPKEDKEA